MKKVFLMILLTVMIIPNLVFAEEIPTSGVTYFLEYPHDIEVVLDEYEDNMENRYELIYEGTSNERGEVILEDLPEDSELRITQIIPNGYSSQESSVDLKLSEGNEVSFVDYKGIINPNTATRSFTWIFILLFVVTVGRMIQKKHAKGLLVVLIAISLLVTAKVKAENQDLVITVKDDKGNKLSGVTVKVYAKPVKIEYDPAIKVSAGEGLFFDGKKEMYVRIPEIGNNNGLWAYLVDRCSGDDLFCYYVDNINLAYRVGYIFDNLDKLSGTYVNGETVNIIWSEDHNLTRKLTAYANDVKFDFYGHLLDSVSHVYANDDEFALKSFQNFIAGDMFSFQNKFYEQDAEYYIAGFDDNPECSHFQYGVRDKNFTLQQDSIYTCWKDTVDGIYYEADYGWGFLRGNDNNCFVDCAGLRMGAEDSVIIRISPRRPNPELDFEEISSNPHFRYASDDDRVPVEVLEITSHGEKILSLRGNNATLYVNGSFSYVSDLPNREILTNYLQGIKNNCSE